MRVLITGSSGLVGKALCTFLAAAGHDVVRLLRSTEPRPGQRVWDPDAGELSTDQLAGLDAVVHLAGEPVAAGRWTAKRKQLIYDSRIKGTQLLSERMATASDGPRVLVAASASGFYGNRGDDLIAEDAPGGQGFLAEVCRAWEDATRPAADAGARVVNLRVGMVLSLQGGALPTMLLPFKLGLGGPLGRGARWMSWIHIEDLVLAIVHCLETAALSGPVNGFAPNPVTNKEFTKALARALKRPAVFPVPPFALRAVLGEMADELLLSSLRGQPERLLQSGFEFQFPELENALAELFHLPRPR